MDYKKYSLSINGLPDHEHIIFKLICSVSERTRNRNQSYIINTDNNTSSDIYINDIRNRTSLNETASYPLNIWLSSNQDDEINIISRPLIATRVLNTLDNLINNCEPKDIEDNISSQQTEQSINDISDTSASVDFNISEEEASELAIVHDEMLENPANQEQLEVKGKNETRNPELKLINSCPVTQKKSSQTNDIRHVLVVDDSASVRKQLEIELEFFNASIDFAESAESAFNLLDSNEYDVALLDVVLPDKDGFQICKRIKANNKSTIAIMLTGKATQADKIKGSLAGCNAYLVKPVGRQTFQNTVKNYLSFKTTNEAVKA